MEKSKTDTDAIRKPEIKSFTEISALALFQPTKALKLQKNVSIFAMREKVLD